MRLEQAPESESAQCILGALTQGCHVAAARDIAHAIIEDAGPEISHAGRWRAVLDLASLGQWGMSSNAERDLHRWCHNLYNSQLEPYNLKLELHLPDVGHQ